MLKNVLKILGVVAIGWMAMADIYLGARFTWEGVVGQPPRREYLDVSIPTLLLGVFLGWLCYATARGKVRVPWLLIGLALNLLFSVVVPSFLPI